MGTGRDACDLQQADLRPRSADYDARARLDQGRRRRAAAAIVVISNELDELLEVCHRIAVIDRGRIVGVVETGDGVATEIGRLMTGAEAA